MGDEELRFERDDEHFPVALTPLAADFVSVGIVGGWQRRTAMDGWPWRIECRVVDGYVYLGRRAMVDDDAIPAAQARWVAGARELAARLADDWHLTILPSVVDCYRRIELLPFEPDARGAWDELWDRVVGVYTTHFLVTRGSYRALRDLREVAADLLDEGLTALTVVPQAPSLERMRTELAGLVALAEDVGVRSALESGSIPDGSFGVSFRRFVTDHGHMGHAYDDLRLPGYGDDPDLLRKEIVRSMAGSLERETRPDPAAVLGRLCAKLTPADAERLRSAAEVATSAGPLTEEHNYWIDRMVHAYVRRAVLGFGERLATAGVIDSRGDVFFLHRDEVGRLLAEPDDVRDLVASRSDTLAQAQRCMPPRVLGGDDTPAAEALAGTPASPGIARGPARFVRVQSDVDAVEPGDVVVCPAANPSFSLMFGVCAAVITTSGGTVYDHAAVVARDCGVPAVTGARRAFEVLTEGRHVEVDGTAGTITLLDP